MQANGKGGLEGPVLVSACLLGLRTRWDGMGRASEKVLSMARRRYVIPVCPEQLGGLPTPRAPAEIKAGDGRDVLAGRARVIAHDGRNVTENYLRGAQQALRLAETVGATWAILKEGSPACGVTRIKRDGKDAQGTGVAAALFGEKGITIEGVD